jgi:hypothetical protein
VSAISGGEVTLAGFRVAASGCTGALSREHAWLAGAGAIIAGISASSIALVGFGRVVDASRMALSG